MVLLDIEMPERCEDCPLRFDNPEGTWVGCQKTMMIRPKDCKTRPDSCPLEEIHLGKPQCVHGKLCKKLFEKKKIIYSTKCPAGCEFYDPVRTTWQNN